MHASDLFSSSISSLNRTRGRTALTMLGIVIGIMSVIMMLSVGEAAQRYILGQVSTFGSDIISIGNGASVDSGQPTLFIKESLTMKDVKKVRTLPWVLMATARYSQSEMVVVNGVDVRSSIVGTTPEELQFQNVKVEKGSFFDVSAVDSHARDIVLGYDIADTAFGAEDAIGKSITINNSSFRVIGIMEKAGSKNFQNVDTQIYMPVTAALDMYNKKYVSNLSVRGSLPISEEKLQLQLAIRDMHNIDNPDANLSKDDFNVTTQDDAIRSASTITNILQIVLVSIAAISLLVGGIGIMNIMYVAVIERIKEIGLRKAIGARRQDILRQFLAEAVMLTFVGGIIGVALGIFLSWLGIQIILQFQTGWEFSSSVNGIVLGVSVSVAIGIVFGYFPARKAGMMTPMEALRTE